MKFLVVLAVFLVLISTCQGKLRKINKASKRGLSIEPVALDIEYLGTCSQFDTNVAPTVQLFAADPLVAPTPPISYSGCLPIRNGDDASNGNAPDNTPRYATLTGDYFCRNAGHGRSIIHLVEVFLTTEDTPVANYYLSLVSDAPFRTTLNYFRRPACTMATSLCSTNVVVSSCTTSEVTTKKDFVLNTDRIFMCSTNCISDTCRNTGATACCDYLADEPGFLCPYTPINTLLTLPERPTQSPRPRPPQNHYKN